MIQYYKDLIDLEGEGMSEEQQKGLNAKIMHLGHTIEFNKNFIRYTQPLL